MIRTGALLVLLLLCASVPAAQANDGQTANGPWMGPGMMNRAEERALDNATHEEMEELMERWMDGTITPAEEDRLLALMNEHPGPAQMMYHRFDRDRYGEPGWGPGHMMGWDEGMGTGMVLLLVGGAVLFGLVWSIVGVLAIIWLLRRLRPPG